MPKIIAIYFSDPEPMGYPFHDADYFEGYQIITRAIEAYGVKAYIVRKGSYKGKGVFSSGWRFENTTLKKVEHPITADLVFNKSNYADVGLFNDCPVINKPEFEKICYDKVKTAELFSEFSPKTAAAESYRAVVNILSAWNLKPDTLVVIKKNFLTEGKGVYILPVKNVHENLFDDWSNVLVQEFLDSSVGIPQIVDGLHDLRVIVVHGTPTLSYVRQPVPGKMLANIAQGGSAKIIALEQVPPAIMTMVKGIKSKFTRFEPTIFSADFMNSPQGFKLIELNPQPGVDPGHWPQDYNNALVNLLVSTVKNI